MKFTRWHTQPEVDPISRMRLRTCMVQGQSMIVPEGWTEEALAILLPHMGSDGFAAHIFERLRVIRQWAERESLFASGEDAAALKDECAYLFASRKAASTLLLDPVSVSSGQGEHHKTGNRHQRQYQRLLGLEEPERSTFLERLRERAALDGVEIQEEQEATPNTFEIVDWPGEWNAGLVDKVIRLGEGELNPPPHRTAVSLAAFADAESRRFDLPAFRRAVRELTALSLFDALHQSETPKSLGLRPTDLAVMLNRLAVPYDSPQGQAIGFCLGMLMASESFKVLAEAARVIESGSEDRQKLVIERLEAGVRLLRSMPVLRLAPPPEFDPSHWLAKTIECAEEALETLRDQAPLDFDPFWLGSEDELDALLGASHPGLTPASSVHPNAQIQMAESFASGGGPNLLHTIVPGEFEADLPDALALAKALDLRFVRVSGESGGFLEWQPREVCGLRLETLGNPPFAIRLVDEVDADLSAFVETLSLFLESGLPLAHLEHRLKPGSQAAMILQSVAG